MDRSNLTSAVKTSVRAEAADRKITKAEGSSLGWRCANVKQNRRSAVFFVQNQDAQRKSRESLSRLGGRVFLRCAAKIVSAIAVMEVREMRGQLPEFSISGPIRLGWKWLHVICCRGATCVGVDAWTFSHLARLILAQDCCLIVDCRDLKIRQSLNYIGCNFHDSSSFFVKEEVMRIFRPFVWSFKASYNFYPHELFVSPFSLDWGLSFEEPASHRVISAGTVTARREARRALKLSECAAVRIKKRWQTEMDT